MKPIRFLFLAVFLLASISSLRAFDPQIWRYQLVDASYLADECLLCGRHTIQLPLRGSFLLRLVEATPLVSRYALENINFQAKGADMDYQLTGSGTFEIAGELAVRQTMFLTTQLKTSSGTEAAYFTNNSSGVTRRWPMLAVTLTQTNGTLARTISLNIEAAPMREIWFSAATTFHTGNIPAPDNEISSGDLLSSAGRVVKRNSELQENFPGPTYQNLGLDAFDLRPGAEIAFSTDTLGVLSDGDIAFLRSFQILHFTDFMSILAPSIAKDPGLDALSFETDSKFYFSIEQDVPGATSAATLHHGDILQVDLNARQGSVFKSNYQLLAQFHPPVTFAAQDWGLDALYIWPSGEIWFSLRDGFNDSQLGPISGGDILSDDGYIVFRNLELLSPFAPIEDVSNFGLDGLSVISDAAPATGSSTLSATINSENVVVLTWAGGGRVFQVERSSEAAGPYAPISEIVSDVRFEDHTARPDQSQAFYRLRQW